MSGAGARRFTENFDAVVSTITIHNVRVPDVVDVIYKHVQLVKPGGCFLNLDLVFVPLATNSGWLRLQDSAMSDALRGAERKKCAGRKI